MMIFFQQKHFIGECKDKIFHEIFYHEEVSENQRTCIPPWIRTQCFDSFREPSGNKINKLLKDINYFKFTTQEINPSKCL